jgi:hypothetical protein
MIAVVKVCIASTSYDPRKAKTIVTNLSRHAQNPWVLRAAVNAYRANPGPTNVLVAAPKSESDGTATATLRSLSTCTNIGRICATLIYSSLSISRYPWITTAIHRRAKSRVLLVHSSDLQRERAGFLWIGRFIRRPRIRRRAACWR